MRPAELAELRPVSADDAQRLGVAVGGPVEDHDPGPAIPLATTDDGFVGVWNINDNGNVPPRWTIGGPGGVLQMVRGVAVNAKHKELIVTDKRLNAILTFSFPELFM